MTREHVSESNPVASFYSALLLLGATFVVFSPLLSLPPFHKGVYFESEPIGIGLSVALAVASMARALRAQLLSEVSTRIPATCLIAGGFALVTLVLSPFHEHSARSLSGSLEFGEGALYFLWLAVSVAAGHSLFYTQWTRWCLSIAMLIMVLILLVTKALSAHIPNWQILGFSDYLAVYIVPVAFVCLALSRSKGRRAGLPGLVVASVLMLCLAWQSDSRSSYAVLLVILLAWLALSLAQRWLLERLHVSFVALVVVAAMVVTFLVVWFIGQQVPPEGITTQPAVVQSIWSRYQLASIALTALSADWSAWLTGLGWGSFRDYLVLYGPGQDGVQFYFYKENVLATNWDSLNRLTGHSHSVFLESLLALGIWGPVLWAALLCSIAVSVKGNARRVVLALLAGQIFITSIWFQLPMVLGFFGLATGMLLAAFPPEEDAALAARASNIGQSRIATVALLAVTSALLFTSAAYAWHKASYGEGLMASVSTPDFRASGGNCGEVHSVPHEGEYSGRALLSVASLLGSLNESSPATAELRAQNNEIREWFARLTCISAADLDRAPSHFLRYARLQARYLLSVSGKIDTSDRRTRAFWKSWPDELEAFAHLGSTREELILAYVNRLYVYGEASDILNFCDPDATRVGKGAACHMFRGMVLAENPETRESGQQAIRHAIESGIKKFMVIPPHFREKYLRN